MNNKSLILMNTNGGNGNGVAHIESLSSILSLVSHRLTKAWPWDLSTLEVLVEKIPVLIAVHRNPKIVYVNATFRRVLGYSSEEMLEMNFWDPVHPDHREIVKSRGLARLRGEEAVVPANYEVKCVKKNGKEIWLNLFFAFVFVNGENLSIVASVDVMDNKYLMEKLQVEHNELKTLLQQKTEELKKRNQELNFLNQSFNNVLRSITDGVVTFDHLGKFEILHPFFSPSDVRTSIEVKTCLEMLFASGENCFISRMVDGKKPFQDEEIKLMTSCGPLFFLASGTPILGEDGAFNRGVIMLRPIREVHRLVNRISGSRAMSSFEDIITKSPIMLELIRNMKNAASSISNVLICGESGTGKELFAQAVHNASPRRLGPFLAINCGAIPRELIGSELFGYSEGAFTGAKKGGNSGKFELANGGTLFLDEIGDMPLEQQATLLRVLQEKSIMKIGASGEIPIDVRIICATNKDLISEIQKGNFRKDLYYRLDVISIEIPSLRERKDDVLLLFQHFLKVYEPIFNKRIDNISMDVYKRMLWYDWPGNVRELQNVVERILNNIQGSSLEVEHLPSEIKNKIAAKTAQMPRQLSTPSYPDLTISEARELRRQTERDQIARVLKEHGGNVSQVAREIGIARSTIYKKMRSNSDF